MERSERDGLERLQELLIVSADSARACGAQEPRRRRREAIVWRVLGPTPDFWDYSVFFPKVACSIVPKVACSIVPKVACSIVLAPAMRQVMRAA